MERVKTPILENVSRLENFYKYLNYEVGSSGLLFGLYLVPGLIAGILQLAAVMFTPYLLYVIYKEEKFGWFTTFIVIVLLPVLLLFVFAFEYNVLALLPFYFYCFLLRFEVKSWMVEMRARNELVIQKITKDNLSNEFEDIFEMRN